jgi:galactitol-specific phosphotransferase system IIB component
MCGSGLSGSTIVTEPISQVPVENNFITKFSSISQVAHKSMSASGVRFHVLVDVSIHVRVDIHFRVHVHVHISAYVRASVADPDRFGPDPDPTSENRPDPDSDPDPDSSK